MLDSKIKKIVLTGGPCAGKTEILGDIEKYLAEKGYYVITIPETATQLIKSRMFPCMDKEHALMFQDIVFKFQLLKEQQAERYAREKLSDKNVIILCDRAIMDNRAYLKTQEEFNWLLKNNGLDELKVLHSYDLVIDLISTATAKKDSYALDGIRSESVEEAAELDKKTTMAWSMHPNLFIFKPMNTLEEKSNMVVNKIDNYLNKIMYNNRKSVSLDEWKDMCISDIGDCRVLEINKAYLKDDLVVTNKKCEDSSILLLGKYSNGFDERIISEEEFVQLLYDKPCVLMEKSKEIAFVEDGNLYKIIDNNGRYYFDYDKQSSISNMSSAINCINKSFVKRKEQC